ncbi:hypothetical protein [Nonlabens xiamenensis]|uniref:hypothetical protein n=1 Tax=Nonlabens xiamenensis TaxID=2341043 RepID=UPI000F60DF04|nr:hypothetical protein [Nonlabens xiamenensis]
MKKDKKYQSDVTEQDKEILGDRSGNLRNDGGDDRLLKHREEETDFAAEGLDIASRANSATKNPNPIKDEENKHYSVSGERHQNLEERERP